MPRNEAGTTANPAPAALRPAVLGAGVVAFEASAWAAPGVDFGHANSAEFGEVFGVSVAAGGSDTGLTAAGIPATGEHIDGIEKAFATSTAEVLGTASLDQLSDAAVLALARRAESLGREVDALRVRVAGEIEARSKLDTGDGTLASRYDCRNAIELIQHLTQASGRTVAKRCRLARETRGSLGLTGHPIPSKFPAVAAALATHTLGLEAAEHITHALANLPSTVDPADIGHAELCLVAAACGTTPPGGGDAALPLHADDVRVVSKAFAAALDQDGTEPKFEEQYLKRSFTFGAEKNGLVPMYGAVSPEVAALFGRMIDAINSPRTRSAEAGGVSVNGSVSEGQPSRVRFVEVSPEDLADLELAATRDERTSAQKRHDALAAIAQAAAQHSSMPSLGGAPVTVMIQVEAEALASSHGTAWLHGHDGELTPLPASAAAHAACAGHSQRVVQNEDGRIVELGTRERIFNAHQRRAIAVRDGGCIIPGCTTPATWCEIHHVLEHARGGKTEIDNGVALCWHHHRTLDSNRWQIRMIDGLPEIMAPPWIDPAARWRPARSPLKAPGIRRRDRHAA